MRNANSTWLNGRRFREDLEEKGVLFLDTDTALREQNGNVNPLGLYDLDRNIRNVGTAPIAFLIGGADGQFWYLCVATLGIGAVALALVFGLFIVAFALCEHVVSALIPEARAAYANALERWANPSSPHSDGRAARPARWFRAAPISAAPAGSCAWPPRCP